MLSLTNFLPQPARQLRNLYYESPSLLATLRKPELKKIALRLSIVALNCLLIFHLDFSFPRTVVVTSILSLPVMLLTTASFFFFDGITYFYSNTLYALCSFALSWALLDNYEWKIIGLLE